MKIKPAKIIRLTRTEFETSDGIIHHIPFNFTDDIPPISTFQRVYDGWVRRFNSHKCENYELFLKCLLYSPPDFNQNIT